MSAAIGVAMGLAWGALLFGDEAPAPVAPPAVELGVEVFDPPEQFSDVAAFCDGTTRVYVTIDDTQAASSVAAIADHPACPPG